MMSAPSFVENTGTKGRSVLMGFADGTVLGLWEHKWREEGQGEVLH